LNRILSVVSGSTPPAAADTVVIAILLNPPMLSTLVNVLALFASLPFVNI